MKIRKWAVIFSSVCAIASMQLTVNAEADRQTLKVALLEYSWENFTSPSMKLGGIENYPMVAYQYSKMDEFMEYYLNPQNSVQKNSSATRTVILK